MPVPEDGVVVAELADGLDFANVACFRPQDDGCIHGHETRQRNGNRGWNDTKLSSLLLCDGVPAELLSMLDSAGVSSVGCFYLRGFEANAIEFMLRMGVAF